MKHYASGDGAVIGATLQTAELILFCASVGNDVFSSTTSIISLRFKGRSFVELVVSVRRFSLLHSSPLWLHIQLADLGER